MKLDLSKDFIKDVPQGSINNSKVGEVIMKDTFLTSEVKEFYDNNYYPNYILGNDKIFNWMFKNNGGKVAILEHDGKVIAHQGHVPIVFTDGENDYKGFISANTMVDKDYRRKGLMSTLRGSVQKRYEMAGSIGGSDQGIALYSAMGYKNYGSMFRMVAVNDPKQCLEVSQDNENLKKTFDFYTDENDSVKEIKNFLDYEKDVASLWNKIFPPKTYFAVKRDAYFLQWRYLENPGFDYRCFGFWQEGSLKALIVFRFEQIPETSSTVIRITELIGEASDLQEIVRATVFNKKFAQDIAWIDWNTTNKKICEGIKDIGFKYREDIKATFPLLCNPMDYDKKVYPVMFWAKDEKKHDDTPKLEDWYLTKGDGDADRPNTAKGYTREE